MEIGPGSTVAKYVCPQARNRAEGDHTRAMDESRRGLPPRRIACEMICDVGLLHHITYQVGYRV